MTAADTPVNLSFSENFAAFINVSMLSSNEALPIGPSSFLMVYLVMLQIVPEKVIRSTKSLMWHESTPVTILESS